MASSVLSEFCVYTIVEGKRLRLLAKQSQAHTFPEGKRWVIAERLWRLRKIVGNHATQELVLRESGKPIAAHFIKP